jgi:hypothetical protein
VTIWLNEENHTKNKVEYFCTKSTGLKNPPKCYNDGGEYNYCYIDGGTYQLTYNGESMHILEAVERKIISIDDLDEEIENNNLCKYNKYNRDEVVYFCDAQSSLFIVCPYEKDGYRYCFNQSDIIIYDGEEIGLGDALEREIITLQEVGKQKECYYSKEKISN